MMALVVIEPGNIELNRLKEIHIKELMTITTVVAVVHRLAVIHMP